MKLYLLSRVLGAADRKTQIVIPVRAFTSRETAQEASRLRTEAINELMSLHLVSEEGPAGLTFGQAVRELGIVGFQHIVDTVDVHDGDILAPPPPSIIIP